MYIVVKTKFYLALLVSTSWFLLCTWISIPWMHDLAAYVGSAAAIFLIFCIALIPGLLQMFLFIAYIQDARTKFKDIYEYPPVSIIMAAYNEETAIEQTILSLLKQDYPAQIEIIVSDDGSFDQTVKIVESMQLQTSNIILIRNQHGGKSNALNSALHKATYELIVGMDADTLLRTDAIKNLVARFLSDPPNTAAVAGALFVKNSRKTWLTRMQEWDFFQSITAVKRIESLFQGTLVAQGAFSLYRKDLLIEIGGWEPCVGEDIVLTWNLLKRNYRVGFCERAIGFTIAPETYKDFFFQRSRWSRGLIEAFRQHPSILLTPRLTLFLIYWRLLFPILDVVYFFVFVPGIILAFFGYFFIVGPMTLSILPITALYSYVFYKNHKKVFTEEGLHVRKNISGFIMYALFYQIIMAPACIHGYFSEILSLKKNWGTK